MRNKSSKEMRKPAKTVICVLLNGSSWSTEKMNMTRYTDTYGIFFEIEHRMRKEEMEEKCNKELEKGWMFAADAVRIIDENSGSG